MTDKRFYQSVSLRKNTYKKLKLIAGVLMPGVKLSNAGVNTLIINKVFDSLILQMKILFLQSMIGASKKKCQRNLKQ